MPKYLHLQAATCTSGGTVINILDTNELIEANSLEEAIRMFGELEDSGPYTFDDAEEEMLDKGILTRKNDDINVPKITSYAIKRALEYYKGAGDFYGEDHHILEIESNGKVTIYPET